MPIDGRLYELDGLREGPIDHGPVAPEQDWLDVVRPIIMKRINVYVKFYLFCFLLITLFILNNIHSICKLILFSVAAWSLEIR